MEKGGYVYIVSNRERTVLSIGVAEDLSARIHAHKSGDETLSSRARQCTDLLYYEYYEDAADAGRRADQLKKWSRSRKDELIRFNNPEWKDLSGGIKSKDN